MSTTITFAVSGKAFSTIEGSEIFWDPIKYDGGSQGAHDAFDGLRACEQRRIGKGYSYKVTTTREGAETIEDYCRTVGETFAYETEPDIRAEGRALLVVADRIVKMLKADQ